MMNIIVSDNKDDDDIKINVDLTFEDLEFIRINFINRIY